MYSRQEFPFDSGEGLGSENLFDSKAVRTPLLRSAETPYLSLQSSLSHAVTFQESNGTVVGVSELDDCVVDFLDKKARSRLGRTSSSSLGRSKRAEGENRRMEAWRD